MPLLRQEPSAKRCTEATLKALQLSPKTNAQLCAASLEARHAALAVRPRSLLELQSLAVYMGLPLRKHPELLWIASAVVAVQLPLGWYEAEAPDDKGGGPFYHCPSLGCVQWEHPAHAHLRGVAAFLKAKLAAQAAAAAAASEVKRNSVAPERSSVALDLALES